MQKLFDDKSYRVQPTRHLIKELPEAERPSTRLKEVGARALSDSELLALVSGAPYGLSLGHEVLQQFGNVKALAKANATELMTVYGIGHSTAVRTLASIELGRRVFYGLPQEMPRVTAPSDAANLLMAEMMHLEQEHLRLILLNTRNFVISTPTIYVGSLNTSIIRVGELYRAAIRANAAAFIVVHNHPTGDPSPSPEDIRVTKNIREAGKLLDIELLDHIIIGHNRFTSLKDMGLGFDG